MPRSSAVLCTAIVIAECGGASSEDAQVAEASAAVAAGGVDEWGMRTELRGLIQDGVVLVSIKDIDGGREGATETSFENVLARIVPPARLSSSQLPKLRVEGILEKRPPITEAPKELRR